jgi:hypothetical protein
MTVSVHSTRGAKSFAFDQSTKVAEVIERAARAFEFPPAYQCGLLLSGNTSTPLEGTRTLASYQIADGASLLFTVISC